ncbi:carbohydrate ABC transporter permease [Streptomyces sp. NPDC020917]|uniref:carbohydrate ABC transporter permease n=1 Tax=Streptomyces sp. NPDC020917 TaxID=3365102 RepID=UPI0037B79051
MKETSDAGLISIADRRRRGVRATLSSVQGLLLVALLVEGAGPLFWMAKGAVTGTQDLLHHPMALWPSHAHWGNIADAWNTLQVGHYLLNSVVLVAGVWAVQIVVATTAGYALSVLKPWYGKYVYGAILVTLFVPGTVTLIAQYVTILHLPLIGWNLIDTPFAVWLPAGASTFNILLVKRFFDEIPRELCEAAQVDGAGAFTVFWRIVLPMSKPILAVVSLLSVMAAWTEFLWPLLVITSPDKQPLAVALPRLAQTSDQALLIAGLFIASLPPIGLFLVFQRYIIRGVSFTGLKG